MNPIITTIIASGVVQLLATFFIKKWMEHTFNKELETYKSKLSRDNELKVSEFKHKLEITSIERNIKLTKIFQDQADIIAEMYAKLSNLRISTANFVSSIESTNQPPESSLEKAFFDSWFGCQGFYLAKKVYFPFTTQINIEAFIEIVTLKGREFKFVVVPADRPSSSTKWAEILSFMNKECKILLDNLDIDFKNIIGLNPDGRQPTDIKTRNPK